MASTTPPICVTGLRGFPDVMGGIESHCEELLPRIAALAPEQPIVVLGRAPYLPERRRTWRGVEIVGPELHGGIIKSWYFYDPNGHRLEIVVPTGGKDVWDRLAELAPAGLDEWNARKANA